MDKTISRKSEHLDIVMSRNVASNHATTGLELVQFEHVALPDERRRGAAESLAAFADR